MPKFFLYKKKQVYHSCVKRLHVAFPVIRNLEEYYDNDLLHGIKAIVNGSTNFILTKMFEDRLDYSEALLLASSSALQKATPPSMWKVTTL